MNAARIHKLADHIDRGCVARALWMLEVMEKDDIPDDVYWDGLYQQLRTVELLRALAERADAK